MNHRQILDELLKSPSGRIWVQIFRYLVSGSAAFVVDAGILALLTELMGERLLLLWSGAGFCAGLATTYLLSISWVFDKRSVSNRWAEISIFICIGAVGLLLTELLMWIFAKKLDVQYMMAKIITTVLVFIWNFTAKKSILFRDNEK